MKTSTKPDTGFRNDAGKYAAYFETPEGRLRLDLACTNLQEFLLARDSNNSICALDLGCGTGATAVRVARLGFHVTMLDSSRAMLDVAKRVASESAVGDQVTLKQGEVTELSSLFNVGAFDVILCHNLLEYVDDPGAVLRGAARLMRGPAAKVRLFTLDSVEAMLKEASLLMIARRGVRTVVDYLPPQISRSAEYERILALERKLGTQLEFVAVARYLHCLARQTRFLSKGVQ